MLPIADITGFAILLGSRAERSLLVYTYVLVLLGVCLLLPAAVGADGTIQITIGPQFRVSDLGADHAEPYIAAHPGDAGTLVAAAMHFSSDQQTFVETYSSKDSGRTWSVTHLPRLRELLARKDMVMAADPWVAFADDGTVYVSVVSSMNPGHPWGLLPLVFYRSRDGGVTWQEPTTVGPFIDRPAFIVSGRDRKQIFIAAMAFTAPSDPSGVGVLRSDDDGATFQRFLLNPSNLGHNALNPVVTPEGELIVPYVDFPARLREQFERRRALMRTSRIYIVASRDGGRTFDIPRFVADIPRFDAGFPEMAVDSSRGPYHGRLYLAWNGEPAELRNVIIARSDNRGETWLATAIKAPNAGPAYFSSLAVSKQGIIGLAWIQHELQEGSKQCWRTYFAASRDGGGTFSSPTVISGDEHSCPTSPQKGMLREHGGDYIGVTAAADGTFHVAWPDSRNGTVQVYTTSVKVSIKE